MDFNEMASIGRYTMRDLDSEQQEERKRELAEQRKKIGNAAHRALNGGKPGKEIEK